MSHRVLVAPLTPSSPKPFPTRFKTTRRGLIVRTFHVVIQNGSHTIFAKNFMRTDKTNTDVVRRRKNVYPKIVTSTFQRHLQGKTHNTMLLTNTRTHISLCVTMITNNFRWNVHVLFARILCCVNITPCKILHRYITTTKASECTLRICLN